jgi:chorismate synthase
MSISAVKAVEIDAVRKCAGMQDSEMNDPLLLRDGKVDFESNHAGGISTGAPIVCTISVKPTPSIAKQQSTVDLVRGEAAEIRVMGRHDPAIPPRIVPVAEVMVGSGADRSHAAAESGEGVDFSPYPVPWPWRRPH